MNIAIIFAGGVGCRMHTNDKPKQFLEMNGKPIIIHTLEHFDEHPEIDGIIVVCVEAWIPFLRGKLEKFNIKKFWISFLEEVPARNLREKACMLSVIMLMPGWRMLLFLFTMEFVR